MALRTPLTLNQSTARIEELAAGDLLSGNLIAGLVGKNKLINGDFRFWQRRTSGRVGAGSGTIGSEAYFADRFSVSALNCNNDVSRGVVTDAATTLPSWVNYAILYNINTLGSNPAAWSGQRIEDVRSLQGQVTLSFYLNGEAGKKVGVRFIQQFGAGGSPTVSGEIAVLNCQLNPTYTEVTFTIPSTAGKIVGANSSLYLVFDFCGSGYGGQIANQSGVFSFAAMQLEAGPVATAFEIRPYSTELALCRRYFRKSYPLDVLPGTSSAEGLFVVLLQTLPVASYSSGIQIDFGEPMRATPAVTIYPKYGGSGGFMTDDAAVSNRAATVASASQSGFYTFASTVSSNQINLQGHWTADAELP